LLLQGLCLIFFLLVLITANGLGLGEVGEIEAQMFNKPLMLIEVQMFKFSTSAPILPNPCYLLCLRVRLPSDVESGPFFIDKLPKLFPSSFSAN
jgi:hypothetical protein